MDKVIRLEEWKTLLDSITTSDKNKTKSFRDLKDLFEHLSPQTAIRLQKDLRSCTLRSNQVFSDLFDTIDLSDKPLLCSYLRMLRSFGYFRLSQIVSDIESDSSYHQTIEKVKWYELTPLLPAAGTIGWKAIMNHGIVKEETELLQVCLQLLSQKLHFCSIIYFMEQYKESSAIVKRNGEKVAEKLYELIRDTANDEESMIGLDVSLFNLLLPFTDENQQAAIIEATVQDLFKPHMIQRPAENEGYLKIFELVSRCIMTRGNLQEILFSKLLEHLKCNIVRRKRRHSIESVQDNEKVTLESLISSINTGVKFQDLLKRCDGITLSSKSLQTGYLRYWIEVLSKIVAQRTISANSAIKMLQTSSVLLISSNEFIDQQLSQDLSTLMVKSVENTAQSVKLANNCNSLLLVALTSSLVERTNLLKSFDSPLIPFYRIVLTNNMKKSIFFGKVELDKIEQFVSLICSKEIGKTEGHVLQYVCLQEIARLLVTPKHKSNKKLDCCLEFARTCSRRLYKFINRNSPLKSYMHVENADEMESVNLELSTNDVVTDVNEVVVVDALVCILKIAVEYRDQEILESYSDLLVRLYNAVKCRVEKLVRSTQKGSKEAQDPLDSQLSKLLIMYAEHKELIKPYLNEDLIEEIASFVIDSEISSIENVTEVESAKNRKKLLYTEVKSKLKDLEVRSKKSDLVYPTIINKHYNSITEKSIGPSDTIQKEKSCFIRYQNQMKAIREILLILLTRCSQDTYNRVLESTINELEKCDPLDHSKVLYIFLVIECLTPKRNHFNRGPVSQKFQEMLSRISCSLIRISKTVEFGPSIRIFTTSGGHKSNRSVQCCTYASCIKIYTLIFLNYPPKITDLLITDAMQLCVSSNLIQYSKYSERLHKFFIQLASAIVGLLKAICMGRKDEEILRSSMPTFLCVFSHLIRCLIMASDRQKLDEMPRFRTNGFGHGGDTEFENNHEERNFLSTDYESQLELIALDIGRTMNNLSFLRVKLIDYAPHLISTYIKDVQRASCPESVRLHLNEGIFRIFNLVDAHQKERREEILNAGIQRKTSAGRAKGSLFEMIHARLDQASREIFRDLHDNYNRFYRYLGKC